MTESSQKACYVDFDHAMVYQTSKGNILPHPRAYITQYTPAVVQLHRGINNIYIYICMYFGGRSPEGIRYSLCVCMCDSVVLISVQLLTGMQ